MELSIISFGLLALAGNQKAHESAAAVQFSAVVESTMRDSRIDAAKYGLMILVIIGHLIEWIPIDSEQVIYRWIYTFHMPTFVFLSGLVCSNIIDVRRAKALAALVVFPYLAHQLITNGMISVLGHESFAYQVSQPYWALWYLMSLFCWRLLMPVILATGAPLAVSIVISLSSGLAPEFNHTWSMGRTASFLPLFVLGHLFAMQGGPRLPKWRPTHGLILLAGLFSAAYAFRTIPLQWLWAHTPYTEFGVSAITGTALRAAQLILGMLGAYAFFTLIPDSQRMAQLGRQSLVIFIGHIYVLKLFYTVGAIAILQTLSWPLRSASIVALAVLTSLACAAGGRMLPWAFNFSWLLQLLERARDKLLIRPIK